jgi:hypothetical protein
MDPKQNNRKAMRINVSECTYIRALQLSLVGLATSAVTTLSMSYLFKEWLLYAIFISGLYFMGSFRFFPWKNPFSKAFSIGVFIGTLVSAVVFIRRIY